MLPVLTTVAQTFAVGDKCLDRLVADFTDADWTLRDAQGHDARWLLGHIATYRNRMAATLGLDFPPAPWEAHFARGTSPADVPDDLDCQAVLSDFHAAHAAMAGAWDTVTAETLARPIGRTMPDGTTDVAGYIGFMSWHEAYHLGQLGLFRRFVGK